MVDPNIDTPVGLLVEVIEIVPEDPILEQVKDESEKSKDLFDRLQRLQAEFDNYRKRMDNRFSQAAQFASEDIILKVLDVYDNILRALQVDFEKDPNEAKAGVEAIQKQLDTILSKEGVRPIESLGTQFDPYYQHAVQKINDPNKPDGLILEEYQRGYMLKEKVLRPAMVCVNRIEVPVEESSDEDNNNSENNGD